MAQIKFATDANGVKFYPITIANAIAYIKSDNTQVKLSEFLDSIDYSGKADKVSGAVNGNFAGLDSNGNLTDSGSKASDFDLAGAAAAVVGTSGDASTANTVYGAKAYADSLASNYDAAGAADTAEQNAKDYADSLASNYDAAGTAAGLIEALDATVSQTAGADGLALSITEADGVITGISGSIAANTYDAYGAAATAKSEVIGTASDTSTANTIYGAKAYADALVVGGVIYKGEVDSTHALPSTGYKAGWEYGVTEAGTYAGKTCQAGDFLIANKDYEAGTASNDDWNVKQGTVAVTDDNASLVIGTATEIAVVEGVAIHVTQVEDTTKIEAVAVADTTEYPDVTSLFTAPSVGD